MHGQRHPTQFEFCFLELNGTLWRGEQYLLGPLLATSSDALRTLVSGVRAPYDMAS
jgi:hypothetical protein